MQRKQLIFVTVGLLLIVAVSGGIYLYYQLDRVAKSLARPGIIYANIDAGAEMNDAVINGTAGDSNDYTASGSSSYKTPSYSSSSTGTLHTGANGAIVNGVQQKVDRPIDNKDLIKAGLIVLQRLDSDEIAYLFRVGSQDKYTKEDLQQVQKVLKTKLTDEDIAVLKELGEKYGKKLQVLDEEIK